MQGTLYLGTSGFAYDEWRGPFYPPDIRSRDMLQHYAARFGSVEINYTFRKLPSERALRGWREAVPDGFRFALKAHHGITHRLRLDAGSAVPEFVAMARLLGDRLGVVLFQCPPTLEYDPALLERFFGALPSGERYAMEFRHPSWEAARANLADRGVAWCWADVEGGPGNAVEPSLEPFGYLRLRRESYSEQELLTWAERIRHALASGRDVHCYFKHEEKGTGPMYAERLRNLIEV